MACMRPRVIIHNTVSLDGSVTGVDVDMELHYRVAGSFGARGRLVGSHTVATGIEMFGGLPEETDAGRVRPEWRDDDDRALWFIPDSTGRLHGKLHAMRESGFCKDVVVLVSETTSHIYIEYLRDRDYAFHRLGAGRVDLGAALDLIRAEYAIDTVLTDCGPSLVAALLARGLADEISLVVAPALVGDALPLFGDIDGPVAFELVEQRSERGCALMRLRVAHG
jgi:2,5-diamino-6-(ribosylamino)-4(3H)-pyrimidinone 5'-phosphate reductase